MPLPLQDGCNSWLSYFLIRGIFPRWWTNCHNIEHIENLYIENLWEQDSKCSCSFFHFCSNLCYITLRLCNFYNSIYSNKSLLNVKIGQYWQKIQASLALFEENMLFLQGSRICASIWIYSILISRQPTPSWKLRSPNNFLGNKRAMGGKRVKTYRRRLSDAVFETSRILQIHNCCLEYGQR